MENDNFQHGILLDSGCSFISIGGIKKDMYYCYINGIPPSIDVSRKRMINYGIGNELSKGSSSISFKIGALVMPFDIHIVWDNISIMLSLADMDLLCIYFNNLTETIIHSASGYLLSMIRFKGYAFITWDRPFPLNPNFSRHQILIDG